MRGRSFINPKSESTISIHINDPELNKKIITYGKIKNINLSLVIMELCKSKADIDDLLEMANREQYYLLNDEEKIDEIIRLKKELSERQATEKANVTI